MSSCREFLDTELLLNLGELPLFELFYLQPLLAARSTPKPASMSLLVPSNAVRIPPGSQSEIFKMPCSLAKFSLVSPYRL